jgi:NADPH:quinone reductase-like Zn-dependent oxidoreductase
MKFDFIFDAVGKNKSSGLKKSLGRNLIANGTEASIDDENLKLDSKRLDLVRDLIETGHIKPFIDRCYQFDELAEAHEYVGKGHKKGGVAITVYHNSK